MKKRANLKAKIKDGMPNNYKGNSAKEVWDSWDVNQREHFLADHQDKIKADVSKEALAEYEKHPLKKEDLHKIKFSEFPNFIKEAIYRHVVMGQYKDGGDIKKVKCEIDQPVKVEVINKEPIRVKMRQPGTGLGLMANGGKPNKKRVGIKSKMAVGGTFDKFLKKSKELGKKGFEKSKEYAGKGYDATKKYAEEKIHDQKKKIALEVIDSTKDLVSDQKYKMVLKGAENIIEEEYQYKGKMEDGGDVKNPIPYPRPFADGDSMENGGGIKGYDRATIKAIKSWGDHGWHYIIPSEVFQLMKTEGIYAHDLNDDSDFSLDESRTPEQIQRLIDSGDFAFFSEDKIKAKHTPVKIDFGKKKEDGGSMEKGCIVEKVKELMRKKKINPDDVSPNFVNDFANEHGIKNLTSEQVVKISDTYSSGGSMENGGKTGGRGFSGFSKGKQLSSKDVKDIEIGDILLNENTQFRGLAQNAYNVIEIVLPPRERGEMIAVKYLAEPSHEEAHIWSDDFDKPYSKWYKAIKKKEDGGKTGSDIKVGEIDKYGFKRVDRKTWIPGKGRYGATIEFNPKKNKNLPYALDVDDVEKNKMRIDSQSFETYDGAAKYFNKEYTNKKLEDGGKTPQATKVEKRDDFWHVRFRSPGKFEEFKTPQWGQKVASSVRKDSEITMGQDKDTGKWQLQKVMVPVSVKFKKEAVKIAQDIACKVDYSCRRRMNKK